MNALSAFGTTLQLASGEQLSVRNVPATVRPGARVDKEMNERLLYEMRTGRASLPQARREPTRSYRMINPALWKHQDWEAIELLDDTRNMWAHDGFQSGEFDPRYMKPKPRATPIVSHFNGTRAPTVALHDR